jgi:membrane-bound lytic murein transglycosylase A
LIAAAARFTLLLVQMQVLFMLHNISRFLLPAALLLLSACGTTAPEKESAPLVLRPASFNDLPGWADDNQTEALAAFRRSCARILKKDPDQLFGSDKRTGTYGDWQAPCRAATSSTDAKEFFTHWFTPWQATAAGDEEGLFTGYYEASLKGSRTRHGVYQHPLYKYPDDLVMVDLGEFRDSLKGERIAGRVVGGKLKPYEDRAAIEAGKLPDKDRLALVWVDDPIDSFFLHVQGSGRILLDDGTQMRVGYAGQNGHVYYAIGRELIKRGEMEKDNVSMQSIRAWLDAHPSEAEELMNTNKSYVFFQEAKDAGPLGGEGVALTPGRSLAVDRTRIPYGTPLWLVTESPASGEQPFERLMVAQDTGGAIRGPVRGDVFWGYGPRAEELAGVMKARGGYWLLLPRSLRPDI